MPLLMQAKPIVEEIRGDLITRVNQFKKTNNNTLDFFIFVNSEDEGCKAYLRNKVAFGNSIGINTILKTYKTELDIVDTLKNNITPFIIQSPALISSDKVDDVLNSYFYRDMDCFGSNIFGLMAYNRAVRFPCTPWGIIRLLLYYNVFDSNEVFCILGRSKIVGSPLEIILRDYNDKTVFVCHSKTPYDIINYSMKNSQVIISAMGNHGIIKPPKNKILVDVGINRTLDNKVVGDFTEDDYKSSRAYTPVPGGVGPMTVACLYSNVVNYYWANVAN